MKFNEKLRMLRETKGYTRKEFSKVLEIGYSTLSHYETGHYKPAQAIMSKIAKNFPESILWLLRDDEDTSTQQINPTTNSVNISGTNKSNIKIDNSQKNSNNSKEAKKLTKREVEQLANILEKLKGV